MNRWVPVVALAGLALGGLVLWWSTAAGPGVPATPTPTPAAAPAPATTGPAPVSADGEPLHVLVLVWDTARADHMSLYGYDRPTTPALDRFAEGALVFEQAHSPGIWTLPSHAAMFTGLPVTTTGADERWLWLDEHHVTAAEHFGAQGWDTFSFAANALLSDDTNLLQGYRVRWNTFAGRAAPLAKAATQRKLIPGDRSQELAPDWKPPEHGATNAEWARAIYKDAGPLVAKGFLKWLDERRSPDKPFFAYLNLMEAHTPRLPSMRSREAVLADDPELVGLGLQTDQAHIRLHFYNFGKQTYSDRELEAITGVYDAALRDLDDATATLLQGIEERGMLDDTVVIVTSDHGENLGDHGLFNHRFGMWESLTHVPLLVRAPGVPAGRVDRPVSTGDLFPTLCRITSVGCPDGLSGQTWLDEGASPVVTTMAEPLRREIQAVQGVHPDVQVEPWIRSGHAVIDGRHKLHRLSDGTANVYDLQADPTESSPLSDAARQAALARELDAWVAGVAPYDPLKRGPRDDPAHVRASQKELRAQLEALGYATDEEPE